MNTAPGYVQKVLETIETSGFEAVLVGGCVRDMLLGRPVHDWDVATSAPAERVAGLFQKTVLTGARFGTITVVTDEGNVEVTTYRSDGDYSDNRRPDRVAFVGALTEDLKRRDFTINAVALRRDGAIVDPFGGRDDMARRLVRCVGSAVDRFSEDALRMFRALRFSAQLGFDIEGGTMAAIEKCAPLCAALSAERVRDETEKILLSDRPGVAGIAVDRGLFAHRLDRAGTGALNFGAITALPPIPELRWAAFSAVLARAGYIASPPDFLRALRLDGKTVRCAGTGAAAAIEKTFPAERAQIKRFLWQYGEEAAFCAAAADAALRGGEAPARLLDVLSSGECWSVDGLAVGGKDLLERGFAAGPGLGDALKKLLEHVLEHPEDNDREILLGMLDNEKY